MASPATLTGCWPCALTGVSSTGSLPAMPAFSCGEIRKCTHDVYSGIVFDQLAQGGRDASTFLTYRYWQPPMEGKPSLVLMP